MSDRNRISNPYRVKLTNANSGGGTVSFDASPVVSENRNVNYNSLEPLHAPGQIQVYKNTSSRNFQLSDIKLISRTIEEADRNLRRLWRLRGWCMPRFGNSSTLNSEQRAAREANFTADELDSLDLTPQERASFLGSELLGAPPAILYLSAYSRTIGTEPTGATTGATNVWQIAQHINRIPVVIQQLTIPYPNDVDYITTTSGVPMPIIMNIDISLLEAPSPDAFESFDLDAFRTGRLQGF